MKYVKYVQGNRCYPGLVCGNLYEVVCETADCFAVLRSNGTSILVPKHQFEEGSIMTEIEKRVDDLLIELETTGGTTFMRWGCPYHVWFNGEKYSIVADGDMLGDTFNKEQIVTFIRNEVGE